FPFETAVLVWKTQCLERLARWRFGPMVGGAHISLPAVCPHRHVVVYRTERLVWPSSALSRHGARGPCHDQLVRDRTTTATSRILPVEPLPTANRPAPKHPPERAP